ncbi:hypothetical protein AAC387_Pa06g2197 [Persea americana]
MPLLRRENPSLGESPSEIVISKARLPQGLSRPADDLLLTSSPTSAAPGSRTRTILALGSCWGSCSSRAFDNDNSD